MTKAREKKCNKNRSGTTNLLVLFSKAVCTVLTTTKQVKSDFNDSLKEVK